MEILGPPTALLEEGQGVSRRQRITPGAARGARRSISRKPHSERRWGHFVCDSDAGRSRGSRQAEGVWA